MNTGFAALQMTGCHRYGRSRSLKDCVDEMPGDHVHR